MLLRTTKSIYCGRSIGPDPPDGWKAISLGHEAWIRSVYVPTLPTLVPPPASPAARASPKSVISTRGLVPVLSGECQAPSRVTCGAWALEGVWRGCLCKTGLRCCVSGSLRKLFQATNCRRMVGFENWESAVESI